VTNVVDWVSGDLAASPLADAPPYSDGGPAVVGTFVWSQENPLLKDTVAGTITFGSAGAYWVYALVFVAEVTVPTLAIPLGAVDHGFAVRIFADSEAEPNYAFLAGAGYLDTSANITAALGASLLAPGQSLGMPGLAFALPNLGETVGYDRVPWWLGYAFGGGGDGDATWGAGEGLGSVADAGDTVAVVGAFGFSRPNDGGNPFDPGAFDSTYRPFLSVSHSYYYTPVPGIESGTSASGIV
jgi:hypothetical protein